MLPVRLFVLLLPLRFRLPAVLLMLIVPLPLLVVIVPLNVVVAAPARRSELVPAFMRIVPAPDKSPHWSPIVFISIVPLAPIANRPVSIRPALAPVNFTVPPLIVKEPVPSQFVLLMVSVPVLVLVTPPLLVTTPVNDRSSAAVPLATSMLVCAVNVTGA